jgi:hypothetical protein
MLIAPLADVDIDEVVNATLLLLCRLLAERELQKLKASAPLFPTLADAMATLNAVEEKRIL